MLLWYNIVGSSSIGAMAILNVGSWDTWVRQVLYHEPGSNFFTYNDDFGDDIKWENKNLQYYLEASLELLDGPDEWLYDMDTKMLRLIMPDNSEEGCPDTDSSVDMLRGRTLDNVIEILDSSDVTVSNITFWASNIIADDDANNAITFDSLIFQFPSSSHRMLKSEAEPIHIKFLGNDHAVINCTFFGGEGPSLYYEQSDNFVVHNSAFSWNDWVGVGDETATIHDRKGNYGEFSQNTLSFNGIAPGLRYGGMYRNITLNYMEGQCWGKIQQDGAAIQVSPLSQDRAIITYNWAHSSPKKGIRFDGSGEQLPEKGKYSKKYLVSW